MHHTWSHRLLALIVAVLPVSCGGGTSTTSLGPAATAPSVIGGVPAPGPINVEITFAADAACTALPEGVRQRTYTTSVSNGAGLVMLGGATFVAATAPYPQWNVIYSKINDESWDLFFSDPPIWEAIPGNAYLVIYGEAHGQVASGTASLPFWGRFEYCPAREPDGYPECEVPPTLCESTNHRLIVRRR